MGQRVYGAMTVGVRKTVDACSTVEHRVVDGVPVVLLAAVEGELATPGLEVVKGAFAKLARADEAAAQKVASTGLPAPLVSGVAVVLLAGEHAFVGATGRAGCYRESGGELAAVSAGFVMAAGDTVVAASHASLATGGAFLRTPVAAPGDATFRNDGLDDALAAALADCSGLLSAAAAHEPPGGR